MAQKYFISRLTHALSELIKNALSFPVGSLFCQHLKVIACDFIFNHVFDVNAVLSCHNMEQLPVFLSTYLIKAGHRFALENCAAAHYQENKIKKLSLNGDMLGVFE